ncbi:hypothetical protein SLEP1_g38592 [Rubroshorea leprosula]|uniref:Uncharacterized protein n=1 Tax=Rubroshorea leprosula TaxID=152421 RepID=A0AAV5KXW1_9ROSI|nr:hypothetical protein SLEP1_g38592 [Rubroshorea leprosula]
MKRFSSASYLESTTSASWSHIGESFLHVMKTPSIVHYVGEDHPGNNASLSY